MTPADVTAAVAAARQHSAAAGVELQWHERVGSTMDVAETAARAGAAELTVVASDEQTSGRGRRGRVWSSPKGAGLYLSLILRPPVGGRTARRQEGTVARKQGGTKGPRHDGTTAQRHEGAMAVHDADDPQLTSLITLASGVAVREALMASAAVGPELKWPNDVMCRGRKVAGLLAEGFELGAPAQFVVVGVGVNLMPAAHPPEVSARATSLAEEAGAPIDRALVLRHVIVALCSRYDQLCRRQFAEILSAWRDAAPHAAGATVQWTEPSGRQHGVTIGIDEAGALLVRSARGTERIVGGELTWIS